MWELAESIPDADTLLALEPEELGAKLLFALRSRCEREKNGMFNPSNLRGELTNPRNPLDAFPAAKSGDIDVALVEAWAWLRAQGLIVPSPDTNGDRGWCVLSRRARSYVDEQDFARREIAAKLPKNVLHRLIADRVWSSFVRGEFDAAVFQAMKAVEVAVREAGGYSPRELGVHLMRSAFEPKAGPLTDKNSEFGEREGRQQLFAGAILSFKNPQSHRDVNLENPEEAIEIIMLANHLLRVVDARSAEVKKQMQYRDT